MTKESFYGYGMFVLASEAKPFIDLEYGIDLKVKEDDTMIFLAPNIISFGSDEPGRKMPMVEFISIVRMFKPDIHWVWFDPDADGNAESFKLSGLVFIEKTFRHPRANE